MKLLHIQQTGMVKIMHDRNLREYKLPELPRVSVEGYCSDANTIYELFGCYCHGHTCQPFRYVATMTGDNSGTL